MIEGLASATDTDEIIQTIDERYNALVDPGFVQANGDLQAVLQVTPQELLAYQRNLEITDDAMQTVLDEYLSILKDDLCLYGAAVRQELPQPPGAAAHEPEVLHRRS